MQTKKGFSTLLIILGAAVVFIAAVLAFGVMSGKKETEKPKVAEDKQVEALKTLSTSDEVPDIEKDLNDTDLETLDVELLEIEKEVSGL